MSAIVILLLVMLIAAAVIAILSGLGKPWPLWVAVLLLCLVIAITIFGGEHVHVTG